MFWESLTHDEVKKEVMKALAQNLDYKKDPILGIPGTFLDQEEFYDDAPFLNEAPFLSVFIANPNHIGCHTLVDSEDIFRGTQQIEKDLIKLCAEQIFNGKENEQDGYVASGGTEANIQAMWVFRNFYKKTKGAKNRDIALVYSEDSHYSMPKGANLLGLTSIVLPVDKSTREIDIPAMKKKLNRAKEAGKKHFIVILNMSTTMFGSVDDIDGITAILDEMEIDYKVHIDGAFGGFIYPFTNKENKMHFGNPKVSSITIDGHKMLQAPYGTGIFLIRKGLMEYTKTEEAGYVQGKDYTICGSRSGANAVAVWMILRNHGSDGWRIKMVKLQHLTTRICNRLDEMGIRYFRNPSLNIIAINAADIPEEVAKKYHLVSNNFEGKPEWWKIVVMAHVKRGTVDAFLGDLKHTLLIKR
ncbi:MAG: aminotransferase class I/II-fold pyridoxal phosphate-dependent enzyme [Bacteroidetes bacterium]|nr:aminotransferase class I/II-fold pyridoxal phosphate-dependent enzyme [Bacteroidota bacterium]